MQMESTENHIVRVTITVKKILLNVRFACSLSFQLRSDSSSVQSKTSYDLTKGQCNMNQTCSFDVEFEYNNVRKKYQDKKIVLTVFMSSPNGKIPAGTANVILTSDDHRAGLERILNLEKCPDKSAQIMFVQSIQFLRKNTTQQLSNNEQVSRQNLKYSAVANYTPNNVRSIKLRQQEQRNSQKLQSSTSKLNNRYQVTMKKSSHSNKSGYQQKSPQGSRVFQQQQLMEKSKISRLQKQKTQYIRQLAKLKGSMHTLKMQLQDKQNQQNLYLITQQLNKGKQKIKIFERNQREMAITIRQLKEQNQKKKNKLQMFETVKNQLQYELQKKQKTIKQFDSQTKNKQQQIEDLNFQIVGLQKKVQVKQVSYKDQIKKLSEKYTLSQTERHKATTQLNQLLNTMENNQRRLQLVLKEKEFQASEEKSKLNKIIQQLNKNIQSLNEQIKQKDYELDQLNENNLSQQLMIQSKLKQQSMLNQQLNNYMNALKKQQQNRQTLQKDLEQLKICQKQRNTYRRKTNQMTQEIAKFKQKFEFAQRTNKQSQKKIIELQLQLKQKSSQKTQLQHKISYYTRQLDSMKKNQQRNYRQAQTLSVQNYSQNQKLLQIKNRIQSERQRYSVLQAQYHDEVTYLTKQKQHLLGQLQELKWSFDKKKQNNQELSDKMKVINEQKLAIHKEFIEKEQLCAKLSDDLRQSNIELQCLNEKLKNMQNKQKQYSKLIKQKNDALYQMQKKLQISQQQILNLNDKIKQFQNYYSQRLASQQETRHLKQNEVTTKNMQITQLEVQLMSKNEALALKQQELKIKLNQLNYAKDHANRLKQHIQQIQKKNSELRIIQQNNNKQNNKIVGELTKKQDQLVVVQKNYNKLKQQWQQYKTATEKALEQLLQQLSKDQASSSNLLAFPDMNLSMLQVEAMKKRNTMISKYKDEISYANEQQKIIQTQLKKTNENIAEREAQYEKQIKGTKLNLLENISQLNEQKIFFFIKAQQLQSKLVQSNANAQKLFHELQAIKQITQQQKNELQYMGKQKEMLLNQIRNWQQKLNQLKASTDKSKLLKQNQLNTIIEQSAAQQQKMRMVISEQQRKINYNEKIIQDKEEAIHALEKNLNNKQYEVDKLNETIQDLTKKIDNIIHQKKSIQKDKSTGQQSNKQLALFITKLQTTITQQQQKYKQIQQKYNTIHEDYLAIQIQNEKLHNSLSNNKQIIQQLQKHIKDHSYKSKSMNDKQSNQLKMLQEKTIQLNSQIQLKTFIIDQNQLTVNNYKIQNQQLLQQIQLKKLELLKAQQTIQTLKSELIFRGQSQQTLSNDKNLLANQLQQLKSKIKSNQEQLIKYYEAKQKLIQQEDQLLKFREELTNCQKIIENTSNNMRNTISQNRKQLAFRTSQQQELKRYISSLQKALEQKQFEIDTERKRVNADTQRQRKQMETEMSKMKKKNSQLNRQLNQLQEQFDSEIETYTNECFNLEGIIAEKEEYINSQQLQIHQYQRKIEHLTHELKNCLEVWDKQKTAYMSSKKHLTQLQSQINKYKYSDVTSRTKTLVQPAKRSIEEDSLYMGIDTLVRNAQMPRQRTNLRSYTEHKQNILNDYKSVQQKIDKALNSQKK